MAVDWARADLCHSLRVQMVDPYNLKTIRGELADVIGGELQLEYYGDTRMGATLDAMDTCGWDGSSALRFIHTVSDYTGELMTETLFTGYVTDAPLSGHTLSLTLNSTLHGMETNVAPSGMTVSKSSKAKDAMASVFKTISRPYRFGPGSTDYLYGTSVVYDAGTDYLHIVNEVADKSGNRVNVDENGIVVIERYVAPSSKSKDWADDTSYERTMVIGPIEYSDNSMQTPERVIVHAEKDKQKITATAIAPAGSASRHSVRGYCIDDFHSENELSPFTQASAQSLANKYLKEALVIDRKCSHSMMYRPLREGDIEQLTDRGQTLLWQVSSAKLDLNTWIWKLDLRGGWKQ